MDIEPNDLRFQYDVIKGQSESIRSMTKTMMAQQAMLADIVQRLARIEANEVNSRVKVLEQSVAALQAERQQRAGMAKVGEWIFKSPLIGWLAGAGATLWLLLSGKGAQ